MTNIFTEGGTVGRGGGDLKATFKWRKPPVRYQKYLERKGKYVEKRDFI